tara:strand:+ start:989 stop:1732 length:744 start_codon:yes stop_codon:yes gene_type:complete
MKGGMEVSETPTTPVTPATEAVTEADAGAEAGAASKSASRQISVIQFCHLEKHCSEETCLDYMDMESMMKPENRGKDIYTTNREGVLGRDPIMATSIWSDWKSEEGTIQLIRDLYPENFQSGQFNRDDFVVYQVDDPEETLEQNRPPERKKVDYIFFINCPFNGSVEDTSAVLHQAKQYATPETKCIATCGNMQDCPFLTHVFPYMKKPGGWDRGRDSYTKREYMTFVRSGTDSFVKFKFNPDIFYY